MSETTSHFVQIALAFNKQCRHNLNRLCDGKGRMRGIFAIMSREAFSMIELLWRWADIWAAGRTKLLPGRDVTKVQFLGGLNIMKVNYYVW